jgi:hypothetical protein
MALRFGKKKDNANDWTDDSLRQELAQISGDPAAAPDATTDQAESFDDFSDFSDFPETPEDAGTPTAPIPTPAISAPPMETGTDLSGDVALGSRPRVSPVLLAAGLVFLVVAFSVGVFLVFFSSPAEDDTAAPIIPPRVAKAPPPDPNTPPPATQTLPTKAAPAPPAKVVNTKTTVKIPATKVVPPGTAVKVVPAGKAGIAPKAGSAPAIAPPKPGQAPRVVPVKGVPTPVGPPPGMAGIPGKGTTRTTSVQIVPPPGQPLTPALPAQLKALWKKGADAKHRGDNAGARAAWQQMLRLHPGHPGVQEAINKLPR